MAGLGANRAHSQYMPVCGLNRQFCSALWGAFTLSTLPRHRCGRCARCCMSRRRHGGLCVCVCVCASSSKHGRHPRVIAPHQHDMPASSRIIIVPQAVRQLSSPSKNTYTLILRVLLAHSRVRTFVRCEVGDKKQSLHTS
eukprot:959355-Rhodomonas_salina.3